MGYGAAKIALMLLLAGPLGLRAASCLACPTNAIPISPGASIQDAVDKAGKNAAFCLKAGLHRLQVVRPGRGQSFQGEGRAIMSGARILTAFRKEGEIWAVAHKPQYERRAR